ncbi:baseplate wedge protein [Xanthomonas phage X1]|nr:baseplate wedge protein [Xanthomonas phage X1]
MKNLPVQSLQFEDIKTNFKEFLKGNDRYSDFNFEASGISTLLNVASYQTHYIGFFVKMLLDEAFIDSAHTRQAMLSHAKKSSYVPKGKQSAKAEVVLTLTVGTNNEPLSRNYPIERGATFKATNDTQDQRIFTVLDGSTIYNRSVTGSTATYTSAPLRIYEGQFRSWNFVVDTSVQNQRFILKDEMADVDTFRVRVKENASSTVFEEYTIASDVLDLDPTSKVFFVSTDENGYYQIFFGNGVFGVQPENGNAVELSYISTNGESGNGAKAFTYQNDIQNVVSTVTTNSVSAGGMEPQTIEELRFAIPNANKRQNRIVISSDYRSILLDKFRNVDSLNVWGGEENVIRDYGKVYMSIKPKNSDKLTALSRTQIRQDIVKKYGVVGMDVVFVDPDFINVDLSITAKLDLRKTTRSQPELFNLILERVKEYNETYLSKFDSILSDVDLLSYIRQGEPAIVSIYSSKILSKDHQHLHNSTASNNVVFGNRLVKGTIESGVITYGTETVKLIDDGAGVLKLVRVSDSSVIVAKSGSVDYTGGVVTYALPQAAKVAGYETSTSGVLEFRAVPSVPDINTNMNNIVRIETTKVAAG